MALRTALVPLPPPRVVHYNIRRCYKVDKAFQGSKMKPHVISGRFSSSALNEEAPINVEKNNSGVPAFFPA